MTPQLDARLTLVITLSFAALASGCAQQPRSLSAPHVAHAPPAAAPMGAARMTGRAGPPANMLASNARKSKRCPSGQKMDQILRVCMPACAGGAASAGGFCMQPPKTSGCGCGKLRDRLTGQCTRACPNGAQPYAGMCGPGM